MLCQAHLMPVPVLSRMALKDRIAEALEESGETPAALARACGVSAPSVTDWLNGDTKTLKALPAIKAARFLKVSVYWLIEGTGAKRQDEKPPEWPFRKITLEDLLSLDRYDLGMLEGAMLEKLIDLRTDQAVSKKRLAA